MGRGFRGSLQPGVAKASIASIATSTGYDQFQQVVLPACTGRGQYGHYGQLQQVVSCLLALWPLVLTMATSSDYGH